MRNPSDHRIRNWLGTAGLAVVFATSACSDASVSADQAQPYAESQKQEASLLERVADVIGGTETVEVPAGTLLTVTMQETVHSKTAAAGSSFSATLADPIRVDEQTLIESGAPIRGTIREVERSKRVKGRARMVLVLDSVQINEEESLTLTTERLQIKAEGEVKKDALTIGGSSAIGAVVGAIAGGGDGAAKGAGIGAAAGTGLVLLTRGDEVEIPAGTKIAFVLASDLDVPVSE